MTDRQTVQVDLGDRSYPIHIGPGLLGDSSLLQPHICGRQVAIITNETVAPLYLRQVKARLDEFDVIEIILPDGEQYKTLEQIAVIWDTLLENRFERSATLIALGGGVIGDMTGFAAATYQRGINFIQVPTTLLSQVDSSVGGKTGVNRPLGKNMVGAFYQPQCVIIDTDVLQTLPDRELKAGIAEVIKYGLINNLEFFHWLQGNISALLECETPAVTHAIRLSCEEKALIVSKDETESGIRAILNLGHTFGHAIETAMGYGHWLHGEAVATGMVMAADLSCRMGMISQQQAASIRQLVMTAGLPVLPPAELEAEKFIELMSRDKKASGGRVRFVLLEDIGKAVITADVDEVLLRQTLEAGDTLANH